MARTIFHASIATDSHEVTTALLRGWLVRPELSMAVRRTGFETTECCPGPARCSLPPPSSPR
ncbi:hypothetical protein [Streptomyces sp. SID5910]|uniref:hypothetical protein n=1 Tax=Streptomyces sp. SID5910 TaxID=2690312 RepID=UPI001371ACD8|nr:hypothetical protein [Streptomyces sp. SID5910]MYR41037.1 hypothetical protein [Streptomyces sp. SID5910]